MKPGQTFVNKDLYNRSFEDFSEDVDVSFIGDDFEDKLEWSMMLIQSKFQNVRVGPSLKRLYRSTFDKAYLMTDGLRDKLSFLAPFTDLQATPDMFPNINIKTMTINDTLSLNKLKQLTWSDRRNIKSKRKYVFERTSAFYMKSNDSFYGFVEGIGIDPDFFTIDSEMNNMTTKAIPKKLSLTPPYKCEQPTDANQVIEEMQNVAMTYQVAMSMFYEWCIYIKEYDNIGLVVPINPSVLKEIYTTSQIKFEDRKRMIHFVKSHYRRKVANPSEDYSVFVKRYLRGELNFQYKGFKATIIPPKYELNRLRTRKKIIDPMR